MKYISYNFFFALILFFAPVAQAQTNFNLNDLATGEILLHINATEREEVEQDLLVADLSYLAENLDPATVQEQVNNTIKTALDLAKNYPDITVSTQQYYVYLHELYPRPIPSENNKLKQELKEPVWRGTQSIQLRSKNSEQLLQLAGELQALKLTVNGLLYQLSAEKREQVIDSLLASTLTRLQGRANETAQALGKTSATLVEIIVNSGGDYPQPMMARSVNAGGMEREALAPQAAPGLSEVTLTISARALIKP